MSKQHEAPEKESYDALYLVNGVSWSFGILFLIFIVLTVVKFYM
ncbi:hypothetical protein [Thermoflavimicrobium daqui]|nr:hypothetical protein [Thermoflavimicrobium daqui]